MVKTISLGRFRHRVKLLTASVKGNITGFLSDYTEVGQSWAHVEPLKIAWQGGDPVTEGPTHIFYMRSRKDIDLTTVKAVEFQGKRHEVIETMEHGDHLEFMKFITKRLKDSV